MGRKKAEEVYWTAYDALAYIRKYSDIKNKQPKVLNDNIKKIEVNLVIEDIEKFRRFLIYERKTNSENRRKFQEYMKNLDENKN